MRDLLSIAVEVEGAPDATTKQLVDQGLDEYNFSKADPDNAEDLWVIARNGEGVVKGGVKARTFYAWMFVDVELSSRRWRRQFADG